MHERHREHASVLYALTGILKAESSHGKTITYGCPLLLMTWLIWRNRVSAAIRYTWASALPRNNTQSNAPKKVTQSETHSCVFSASPLQVSTQWLEPRRWFITWRVYMSQLTVDPVTGTAKTLTSLLPHPGSICYPVICLPKASVTPYRSFMLCDTNFCFFGIKQVWLHLPEPNCIWNTTTVVVFFLPFGLESQMVTRKNMILYYFFWFL